MDASLKLKAGIRIALLAMIVPGMAACGAAQTDEDAANAADFVTSSEEEQWYEELVDP